MKRNVYSWSNKGESFSLILQSFESTSLWLTERIIPTVFLQPVLLFSLPFSPARSHPYEHRHLYIIALNIFRPSSSFLASRPFFILLCNLLTFFSSFLHPLTLCILLAHRQKAARGCLIREFLKGFAYTCMQCFPRPFYRTVGIKIEAPPKLLSLFSPYVHVRTVKYICLYIRCSQRNFICFSSPEA